MASTVEPLAREDVLREALVEIKSARAKLRAAELARTEPIAIVGMGCRLPGGAETPELLWRLLREGRDGIREVPADRWDVEAYYDGDPAARGKMYVRQGGFLEKVDGFDAHFFRVSPREAVSMDPQHRLLLEVAWEALENAGIAPDSLGGSLTGVFVGMMLNDYAHLGFKLGDPTFIDAHHTSGCSMAFAAGRLSYFLGLQGPSLAIDTACSSSLVAVHLASQSLRQRECRLALAGGVNLILAPETSIAFCKSGMLSRDGRCKTFDASADGMGRGEGCGIVVLKRLSDAQADGDGVLALVLGSAVNQDGPSAGLTVPSGPAQEEVIRQALAAARVKPSQVGYVEAHGTGTPLGDPIEMGAVNAILCHDRTPEAPLFVGSIKTNMGHLEGAAGVSGLMKAVLAVQHGEIPPHLNLGSPSPHIDWNALPIRVPAEVVPWPATEGKRIAGVSSFGLSGTNAHVVLGEAPPTVPVVSQFERPAHLLAFSAKTDTALRAQAERLLAHLREYPELPLANVAFSANVGRAHFHERACVLASERAEAESILAAYAAGKDVPGLFTGQAPASGAAKVAFLFTGQGSQYVGMGRQLYETQPTFRRALDECAEVLRSVDIPLLSLLYPTDGAASPIDQTAYAQPALFALEYALAQLWISWGVRPAAVLGHSVGEYVAACIAGVFSLEDGLKLIAERGRLMQALPQDGVMVAVSADAGRVGEAIASHPSVSIAAINGPNNVVVSGYRPDVEAVSAKLEGQGVKTRRLTVSHAFHSALMDPMLPAFERAAAGITYASPVIDLLSNLTGGLSGEEVTQPGYWCRHLRQTVQFAKSIELLCDQGYGAFVEVGPEAVLVRAGRQCRPEHAALWAPSLRRDAPAWPVLLQSLAELYVSGQPVQWAGFDKGYARRHVVLPTYPFERESYWLPTDGRVDQGQAVARSAAAGREKAPERKAALHARPHLRTTYEAPTTPLEARIAEVWQEVLGIERIGLQDDFFELGGDSLLASVLITRLREAFQVDLPMDTLLVESATVAGTAVAVARYVKVPEERPETASQALPTLVPATSDRHLPFPLTDIQQAYWIGRNLMYQLGDVSIHAYTEIDAEDVDLDRLQTAWNRLVERHDMLRAVVLPTGEQQVLESVPAYEFRVQDLRASAPDEVARELQAIREEMSHQVLAVDAWPAFDIRATRLDDHRTRLHLSIDLLNCDAGSLMILNAEWVRLYGDPQLQMKPLELAYRDYVLAAKALSETESYKRSWEYWRERVPLLPPAPELPASNVAGGAAPTRFVHRVARIDAERWQRLKSRATRLSLTASSVLLTAYAEILAAWSRNPALTVNVTLFNRLPLHPEVNDIVGDFTSMILLGTQNAAGEPFQGRAREIQKQLWSDLEHRFVSGVQVLRELARVQGQGTGALMPVVFTSLLNLGAQGFRPPLASLRGLGEVAFSVTQTPQVLLDHQVLEEDGALVLTWDAVEGAFPPGLLDDMFAAYQELLGSLADEDGSWQQPRRTHVPAAQLEQRAAVNATDAPIPERTLRDLFEERAIAQPDAPAVIASTLTLTYGELRARAHALGRRLRALGARPGKLVAVVMQKGWEQIVGVLGIHAAGAAYVPIDPALPMERRRLLLADADTDLVVTQPWLDRELEWPDGLQRISVDAEALAETEGAPLDAALSPGDLSHVIYTSGSTGRPKGVMIEHRSVVNRILDVNMRQAVGPGDRVLALTALNHDLSVYDIFGLLSAGGALVVPDAEHTKDPAHWAARMASENVTIWNSVPAYLEMLVEYLERRDPAQVSVPETLRWVILSGDWIPVTLPDRLRALVPGVAVIASGGPTETTIWDIWNPVGDVDPRWSSIPYGKPMTNARYEVLNRALEPCPVWAPGELCISGAGVARGYWRDEARTRERFVVHPKTGERIYRSGDQGRYLPDGNIEFLGRLDGQVKVGGYRIELGEIEATLRQHPAVRALALKALGETRSHKRLVAYVVPTQEYASALGSPEVALMEEYRQYEKDGIALLDPLARLEFKKKQPGLRGEEGRPAIPLARPALDEALLRAYVERRSYREYVAEAIPLADLAQLLGGLSFIDLEGLPKYRYGSAGGLYPVQTYLYVKAGRVEGLDGGTYYYDPREHRLVLLTAQAEIRARVHAPNNRTIFDRSAFSIFLVAQTGAIQPMYGKWARDFCVLEAGYMSQLLMTISPESQIGLCPIGDMDFESVRELFALDDTHLFVHSLLGGGIRPEQKTTWAPEQQAFAQQSAQRSEESHRKPDLASELGAFLKSRLPEQMVPATFVFLEALPLTANGKVNLRALPEPTDAANRPTAFVAASTEVEEALSAIVRDVLHVDQVSVESNFFDLGGNSVHMVQILSRLRDAFGREVAITEIFRHPTIHALAGYLGEGPAPAPSLARSDERADKRRARMSARQAQRRAAQEPTASGEEP